MTFGFFVFPDFSVRFLFAEIFFANTSLLIFSDIRVNPEALAEVLLIVISHYCKVVKSSSSNLSMPELWFL